MTQDPTVNLTLNPAIEPGSHLCPAPNCDRWIQSRFLFCLRHWRKVPHSIRSRIWAAWRRLQVAEVYTELLEARRQYSEAREAAIRSLAPAEAP